MYDRQFDGWGRNLTTGSETFKSQNLGIRSKLLFTPGDRTAIPLTGDYMRVRNWGVCGHVVPGAVSFTRLRGYPGRYNTRSDVDQFARQKTHGFSTTFDHDPDALKLHEPSAFSKQRGHN